MDRRRRRRQIWWQLGNVPRAVNHPATIFVSESSSEPSESASDYPELAYKQQSASLKVEQMYINLFHNPKIGEKNSEATSRWISPYIKTQLPKLSRV